MKRLWNKLGAEGKEIILMLCIAIFAWQIGMFMYAANMNACGLLFFLSGASAFGAMDLIGKLAIESMEVDDAKYRTSNQSGGRRKASV